jgi:hypothetical protein
MTTNHGKVMEIGEAGICTDTMRLQIAEGTTITGFYATHVSLPCGSIISMN